MKTLEEVGNSFFSSNVKHLVEEEPYWSFVLQSAMIEFMGKCYSIAKRLDSRSRVEDMQEGGHSKNDFGKMIQNSEALKGYQALNNNDELYHNLRCGMLHALLPKEGIQLAPEKNDLQNKIIGADDLYNDLQKAWENIKKDSDTSKFLEGKVLETQGELSGATQSLIS